MERCEGCGYMWMDLDNEGTPISGEYCHYEGPDEWAPCMQDDAYDYTTAEYEDYWVQSMEEADYDFDEEYQRWLAEQKAMAEEEAEGYWNTHAEPSDYGNDDWPF